MCSKILRPLLGYANFVDSASVPTKVSICLYRCHIQLLPIVRQSLDILEEGVCHIQLRKRTVTTIQGHALETKTD